MTGQDPSASAALRFSGTLLDDDRPHIGELVERIGFGWAQARAGILGGGVWLADGAELLLISSVSRAVGEEWGMSPMARGFIVTIVFCGIVLGNFASGPLGDNHGRRHLILVSYFGIFVFSVCSAFSTSVAMLVGVRLLVGIAIGLGQPAWVGLSVEVAPAYWRGTMNGFSQSLFAVGEAYTAVLLLTDDPTLAHVQWRWLLVLGAIPSAFFFLGSLAFLNQSPSFLAIRGRREEAMVVLESMRDSNCAGDFSVDFQDVQQATQERQPSKPWFSEWSLVFSRQFGATTLIVMFSLFALNFCYYGAIYAFPQILRNVDMGGSPAMHLLLGALAEIPGYAFGVWIATVMPRKPMMKLLLTFIVGSLFSLMVGIQHVQTSVGLFMATAGFYSIKFFLPAQFVLCCLYLAEVFPAEIRITGSSVCMASGKLASMIAPLAYEGVSSSTPKGGSQAFLMMLLGLAMTNAGLINLLPFETFGMPLQVSVNRDGEQGNDSSKIA